MLHIVRAGRRRWDSPNLHNKVARRRRWDSLNLQTKLRGGDGGILLFLRALHARRRRNLLNLRNKAARRRRNLLNLRNKVAQRRRWDSPLNYRKCHRHFLPNFPSNKLHEKFGVYFRIPHHEITETTIKVVSVIWRRRWDSNPRAR